MTLMMTAKMVTKQLTCSDCGLRGEFVYEEWPGGHGEPVFRNLSIGFTASFSGNHYAVISCACGAMVRY
jgi:hypothetical protein